MGIMAWLNELRYSMKLHASCQNFRFLFMLPTCTLQSVIGIASVVLQHERYADVRPGRLRDLIYELPQSGIGRPRTTAKGNQSSVRTVTILLSVSRAISVPSSNKGHLVDMG